MPIDHTTKSTLTLEQEFEKYLNDLRQLIPNSRDCKEFMLKHNSLRGIWKELEHRGIQKVIP